MMAHRPLTFPGRICALLVLMLLASIATLAQAQSAQNAGGITFSGVTYHLAWQSQPQPNYRKYEYLPQDQELPHYRNMLLLEEVSGATAADAVRAQLDFLQQRQQEQNDIVANHSIIANQQTGEFLLDFVLSGNDPQAGSIIEWNVYRYVPHRTANGQPSVLLYGYSARGYGDEGGRDFLIALKDERPRMINAMVSASVPPLP